MAAMKTPDIKQLRAVWNYSSETGVFYWRIRPSRSVQAGARADSRTPRGYRVLRYKGLTLSAHRVAFAFIHGYWPPNEIDHINGNREDNRANNLRNATLRQNQHNRQKRRDSSTPYKGVTYRKRGNCEQWIASIHESGIRHHLGSFRTAEEAAHAYDLAALKRGGQYARINVLAGESVS